jgi:hypothetical protein
MSKDGDAFWLCGTHIPRNDGVCDYTLRAIEGTLHENSSKELPAVIVQDLVTDPRFFSSPYCKPGSPARFYAAVPIRSPRGINIGVFCVINSKPGADWKEEDTNVLRGLSQTIMDHLEGNRVKKVLKRNVQMSIGLRNFSNGRLLSSKNDFKAVMSAESINAEPSNQEQTNAELGQSRPTPHKPTSTTSTIHSNIPEDHHENSTFTNPFPEAAIVITSLSKLMDVHFSVEILVICMPWAPPELRAKTRILLRDHHLIALIYTVVKARKIVQLFDHCFLASHLVLHSLRVSTRPGMVLYHKYFSPNNSNNIQKVISLISNRVRLQTTTKCLLKKAMILLS